MLSLATFCHSYLACLERTITYINKNAYIICCIESSSFCQSAATAVGLLLSNLADISAANFICHLHIGVYCRCALVHNGGDSVVRRVRTPPPFPLVHPSRHHANPHTLTMGKEECVNWPGVYTIAQVSQPADAKFHTGYLHFNPLRNAYRTGKLSSALGCKLGIHTPPPAPNRLHTHTPSPRTGTVRCISNPDTSLENPTNWQPAQHHHIGLQCVIPIVQILHLFP